MNTRPRSDPHNVILGDRDLILFRLLFESRIMTLAHISKLVFNGSLEAAKKRLQKLKRAGFISERSRKVYDPSILSLSLKSLAILREHGIMEEYLHLDRAAQERRTQVGELTVRHELQVMDVKVAFHDSLVRHPRLKLNGFFTWPILCQFDARSPRNPAARTPVKPDGFFCVEEAKENGEMSTHNFFLEVDRSTECLATLSCKARQYLEHYRSGGFALSHGEPRSSFRQFPFRVLIVVKTIERRNNLAERLLQSPDPILTLALLSTIKQVVHDPLGAIWIRPQDYRDAIRGSSLEYYQACSPFAYRRAIERDRQIDAKIRPLHLFE